MTVMTMTGAASDGEIDWHSIDWAQVHRTVRRLQRRIAKATREGRWGKVKALQWLLTHSLHGKMLAVKRVTENQGKRTPGVDGATWSTPGSKTKAVMSLRRRGYQPSPLRRVYIPKANGKEASARNPDTAGPRHAGAVPAGFDCPSRKPRRTRTPMASGQKERAETRRNNATVYWETATRLSGFLTQI